jgi:hypothetical protein
MTDTTAPSPYREPEWPVSPAPSADADSSIHAHDGDVDNAAHADKRLVRMPCRQDTGTDDQLVQAR